MPRVFDAVYLSASYDEGCIDRHALFDFVTYPFFCFTFSSPLTSSSCVSSGRRSDMGTIIALIERHLPTELPANLRREQRRRVQKTQVRDVPAVRIENTTHSCRFENYDSQCSFFWHSCPQEQDFLLRFVQNRTWRVEGIDLHEEDAVADKEASTASGGSAIETGEGHAVLEGDGEASTPTTAAASESSVDSGEALSVGVKGDVRSHPKALEEVVGEAESEAEIARLENTVEKFRERMRLLEDAVARGDLDLDLRNKSQDPTSSNQFDRNGGSSRRGSGDSGGLWLNGLQSYTRAPAVSPAVFSPSPIASTSSSNSTASDTPASSYAGPRQLLQSHRGFMHKELARDMKQLEREVPMSSVVWKR